MNTEQKLAMLEEIMELDPGTLKAEMELDGIEEYDSMTKLALIVMADDEFGKKLTGAQIKEFKTVQDILDIMEK